MTEITQSPLSPKARANSGYYSLGFTKGQFTPGPLPDSNQSPCCFKWTQRGCVCCNYHCSSGNTYLMVCMWKCVHLQMDTSTCQVEEAHANARTVLPLHWVNFSFFFFTTGADQLWPIINWFCWLSAIFVLIKLGTAYFLWFRGKDLKVDYMCIWSLYIKLKNNKMSLLTLCIWSVKQSWVGLEQECQ